MQGHDHNGSQAFHYQPQDRHQPPMPDHVDPSQPSMGYPYPPAQHHVPYMDPYYAPHPAPHPGLDGYGLGLHLQRFSDLDGALPRGRALTGGRAADHATTARVVQFVGSGSCGATDGGTE